MTEHEQQLERLIDRIHDQNWRDAERYRWLREQFATGTTTSRKFDESIDRAMAEAVLAAVDPKTREEMLDRLT